MKMCFMISTKPALSEIGFVYAKTDDFSYRDLRENTPSRFDFPGVRLCRAGGAGHRPLMRPEFMLRAPVTRRS